MLKFRRSLTSRISRICNDSQNYFNEIIHVLSKLSRVWMGSIPCIRGPSCQSALQTSALVRDFCGKQRNRYTSAIGPREGQGSIPENEHEEGRNWKASCRAWSASYHLLQLGHAPTINSFTWVWQTNSRNYFNETFKNDYSRIFRPAKFKRYTVLPTICTVLQLQVYLGGVYFHNFYYVRCYWTVRHYW